MNLEELQTYLHDLQTMVDDGRTTVALNEDGAHNAAVMLTMLKNASTIKMFCGACSVFTEGFYEKISRDNNRRLWSDLSSGNFSFSQNPDGSYTAYDNYLVQEPTEPYGNKDIGVFLRNEVYRELDAFLSKGNNSLDIIVENAEKFRSRPIFDALKDSSGKLRENVKIRSLDDPELFKGFVFHFSFAYKDEQMFMVRMESDSRKHAADCLFYPSKNMGENTLGAFKNIESVAFVSML